MGTAGVVVVLVVAGGVCFAWRKILAPTARPIEKARVASVTAATASPGLTTRISRRPVAQPEQPHERVGRSAQGSTIV